MKTYICKLPDDLHNCEFRSNDGKCTSNKDGCGFKAEDKEKAPSYIREARWYEKYYKK